MWTVEQLEKKVAELTAQVEQSAANHHILVGSKMTFMGLLEEAKKAVQSIEVVADATMAIANAAETVAEAVN